MIKQKIDCPRFKKPTKNPSWLDAFASCIDIQVYLLPLMSANTLREENGFFNKQCDLALRELLKKAICVTAALEIFCKYYIEFPL